MSSKYNNIEGPADGSMLCLGQFAFALDGRRSAVISNVLAFVTMIHR